MEWFFMDLERISLDTWTEVNDVNTARENLPGSGSTTAGLVFGGYTTTPQAVTENWNGSSWTWNGSSWTEVNDLNTGRMT